MALSFMHKDIGIDLGTSNTLVYMSGIGIVLREPSVVVVGTGGGEGHREILAIGAEASAMLGRTPGSITAIRPLKDGVIADYEATEMMLKYFIRKCTTKATIFGINPRVVICIPCRVTAMERRAVEDAVRNSGAREVVIIDEPLAAALGAGLDIYRPRGSMIVDIGGGTAEVAVMSLGGIVVSRSLRVGGNKLDEAIAAYVKKKYCMVIGEKTAEELKIKIGSLSPAIKELSMETRGRDVNTGLPVSNIITSKEVREALTEPAHAIVDCVRQVLEDTPPELAADILESGITLSGGGALIRGMAQMISGKTGVIVKVAEHPLDCVALGAGRVLEESQEVRRASVFSKLSAKESAEQAMPY